MCGFDVPSVQERRRAQRTRGRKVPRPRAGRARLVSGCATKPPCSLSLSLSLARFLCPSRSHLLRLHQDGELVRDKRLEHPDRLPHLERPIGLCVAIVHSCMRSMPVVFGRAEGTGTGGEGESRAVRLWNWCSRAPPGRGRGEARDTRERRTTTVTRGEMAGPSRHRNSVRGQHLVGSPASRRAAQTRRAPTPRAVSEWRRWKLHSP